ncbi:hypothetical protein CAP35_06250 [Chitinophagaceae bacterium IBVUCB1]|nr:hypothetical protein CAP35_06250 [Chitinophagaceae bacterium IBVUCB1]
MIAIDNVLLSDQVVEEQFVCDLNSCKGGCCVDGDCGAPLTQEETVIIASVYPKIKEYLLPEYVAEIEKQGTHTMDDEFGYVTPAVNGGICVYAYRDDAGIVKCTFERAWNEGKIAFKKPISCHLYPIRVKQMDGYEAVNYEPRKTLCKPACKLGKQLKVPVYQFLKDSIVRKYGNAFYDTLDAVAKKIAADKAH